MIAIISRLGPLAACAALLPAAGCGVGQPTPGAPLPNLHARRASSIAPVAKQQELLYVTNSSSKSVFVYSFPEGKLLGTLTGFGDTAGECVDSEQNVWIADSGNKLMLEYAHGGTKPIATLRDTTTYPPFACSVDPTTGNLAVVTGRPPYGVGEILVYKQAKSPPQKYPIHSLVNHPAYDGYDDEGNLFVDGLNGNCCRRRHPATAVLAELPEGGTAFETITVHGGLYYPRPGGVEWDGSYITVVNVNVVYRLSVSGSSASVVGSATLKEANSFFGSDVSPDWIVGNQVVAADYSYDSKAWNVGLWKYPAGGEPVKHFSGTLSGVYGVAVSLK